MVNGGTNMEKYTGEFLEDQELLKRYREGDNAAFGVLYTRYESRALSYARRHTRDLAAAEDLASEAFARILDTIRRGKGPTVSMNHYLITTIRTIAWRNEKARGAEDVVAPDSLADMLDSDTSQEEPATEDWLVDAFNRLDERKQTIVWLRLVEGYTSSSIATHLSMTGSSVTRQYQSAVNDLRKDFVKLALETSPDPHCRSSIPQLMKLAESVGARAQAKRHQAGNVAGHIASCDRCQALLKRLRSPDSVLMSTVVLATLGTIGSQALSQNAASATAAASSGWFASLALPAKIFLVGAPVVVVAGAALIVGNALSSPPVSALPDITLGSLDPTGSGTKVLVSLGECEITREPQETTREVWHLSQTPECDATISVASNQRESDTVLIDTLQEPTLRFIEVARPGSYTIELHNGTSHKTVTVQVTG
jgi:RNA polymerase sigma factor (sigma-70 family)